MRIIRVVFLVFALLLVLVVNTRNTSAKPDESKKIGKPCTACHVKTGSKDLNDAGKYYKENKKLPEEKPKK